MSDYSYKASKQPAKKEEGKPRAELLSAIALLGTAAVLTAGAKKHSENGWRTSNLKYSQALGSCLRHLLAFLNGEDTDDGVGGTGLPHIDCLAAEVMFLQELSRTRPDLDDRYKVGK